MLGVEKLLGLLGLEKPNKFWRIAVFLPIAIPTALGVFSIVAVCWLLINQFNGWYVWPTASLAAIVAVTYLYKKYPHEKKLSKETKICTILVLAGVFMWVGINSYYTSQHIHTDRDPATYAVTGIWLSSHDNLQIPQDFPAKNKDLILERSAGFQSSTDLNTLYAQGAHLLPALLGLVGKLTNPSVLLHINPLFGGTALLAVYGFARLLMRQRWALVATGAFALSLPLIYFSRDTYTEPLAMTFTFAAMSLLVLAYRTKEKLVWILAGLLAGAGQLARIDMVLSIIGMVFTIFVILFIVEKKERKQVLIRVALFTAALALVMLLGFLDVMLLSNVYFKFQIGNIRLQMMVLGAVVAAGLIATGIVWNTRLLRYLDKKTHTWRAKAAATSVGLICIALASRPFWMEGHRATSIPLTEGLQAAAGLPINGFRDYSEITVNWISWYVGLPLVVLSLLGLMLVAYRAMRTKDIVWILGLAVVFSAALAYLVKPSITPDQIWASRRLLPVVMPGVAIFGALAIHWIAEQKKLPWKLDAKVVTSVLATVAIIAPLITSLPFLRTRTYVPMLAQTQEVCELAPANAAILWIGMSRLNQIQPTRAVCNVPSAGLKNDDFLVANNKKELAQIARDVIAKGRTPIIGVYGSQFGLIPTKYALEMREASAIEYNTYNHHLVQAPKDTIIQNRSLLLGEITTDGEIKAIEK